MLSGRFPVVPVSVEVRPYTGNNKKAFVQIASEYCQVEADGRS